MVVISAQEMALWSQSVTKWVPKDTTLNFIGASKTAPIAIEMDGQDQSYKEVDEIIRSYRLIAFPVYTAANKSGSSHWTLGILYNQLWNKTSSPQLEFDWHLFHFNSLVNCNRETAVTATEAAQYLTKTDFKVDIKYVEVPVPRQEGCDCGLYPAHFLKVFLCDLDASIEHCLSVRLNHFCLQPS
jgi:hypothetical protein